MFSIFCRVLHPIFLTFNFLQLMESISSKINSFLEEHSLDLDKIDYVRLFIENAGELISLGRDCFQDLEGVFQYDNDFEAKLWACHQNAFFGNEITNYYLQRRKRLW